QERRIGVLFPGDAAQPDHVLHQQVEAAGAKIPEVRGGGRRTPVATVIVTVDRHTGRHQRVDRVGVAPDVLAHTVRDLDHATDGASALPAGARDAQPVRAGESKLVGLTERHHGFSTSFATTPARQSWPERASPASKTTRVGVRNGGCGPSAAPGTTST